MSIEIKVPAAGESVTEADIAQWYKASGDYVALDEAICELETDKASMDISAEVAGILTLKAEEGDTVQVGQVIAVIDPSSEPKKEMSSESSSSDSTGTSSASSSASSSSPAASSSLSSNNSYASGHPSPAAAKVLAEKNLSTSDVSGTGKDGRITKQDAVSVSAPAASSTSKPAESKQKASASSPSKVSSGSRTTRVEKMSRLRKTIAKRLVEAQQSAALLTTFNEVDLSEVMAIRTKYKESFKEKFDVGLGFMSFFTKAVCRALRDIPAVNAQIVDDTIVYHDYCDIGVAVSTPKGLIVPVVRNAESMSFNEIESAILGYAIKGREGAITPEDMEGGTFTITNGGVFGSMLSTPIVNRPQSAILGMHNIIQRPVAVNGNVVIRPMMYIALTYDHRIIDGKEAVTFLVKIKELLEDPSRLLLGL